MITAKDFLQGMENPEGLTVSKILNMNDKELEVKHNWVQWAFATPEKSMYNMEAPTLSLDESKTLSEAELENLKSLGERYFSFMMWNSHWRFPQDHNHLRITRVLQSLKSADLEDLATKIYNLAMNMGRATDKTKEFWTCASNGRVLPVCHQTPFLVGTMTHDQGQ